MKTLIAYASKTGTAKQCAEALAGRILLIGHGRLLLDGAFDDVRRVDPGAQSLDELAAALYARYGV